MRCALKTLGDVAEYINGRAFKPSEWEDSGLPIIRIQNLTDKKAPCHYSSIQHEEKYLIHEGDLLFAWAASLGAHIWHGQDAWLNQHIFKIIPHDGIVKKYLYYFLLHTIAQLYSKSHGSGMVHITKGPFLATQIPVPSLAEQERIVAKIEELFSQLEKGKESLRTTKERLNLYRMSVLKDACEGRIPRVSVCHRHLRIQDFANVGTGATPLKGKKQYYGGTIPWIASGRINDNKIFTPSAYITELALRETNCKLYPPHTILVAMYGEGKTRGMCAELMIEAATNQAIAAIELPPDCAISKDFLLSFLELNYQQLRRKGSGGVQPNLNLSIIKNIWVPCYSLDEQAIIIRTINERLSVFTEIEKSIDKVLALADSVRQSILKKAFEGKLA